MTACMSASPVQHQTVQFCPKRMIISCGPARIIDFLSTWSNQEDAVIRKCPWGKPELNITYSHARKWCWLAGKTHFHCAQASYVVLTHYLYMLHQSLERYVIEWCHLVCIFLTFTDMSSVEGSCHPGLLVVTRATTITALSTCVVLTFATELLQA